METFTKELCELLVGKKIPLSESLKLMSKRSKKINSKTAFYMLSQLEKGELLSNALKTCPYIHFDSLYVNLISMAEKSENLNSTLQYLNHKNKRYKENQNKMFEAFIYPFFVIALAFIICLFLSFYLHIENSNEIYVYFYLFFALCLLLILSIWKILSVNKMYEAFLGTDLLVKSGFSISSAVLYGAFIAGPDTKTGKIFLSAGEKMEYGMDLINAFSFKQDFQEAFYYADISGEKKDVFEKVAIWIAEKDEKRRAICLQLIEPVFIAITGSFLLIIILNFFVPVLNNFNLI